MLESIAQEKSKGTTAFELGRLGGLKGSPKKLSQIAAKAAAKDRGAANVTKKPTPAPTKRESPPPRNPDKVWKRNDEPQKKATRTS